MFLLSAIVVGIIVGFLRGGNLHNLAQLQLRFAWLLLLGLLVQTAAFSGLLPLSLVPALYLLSYGLILGVIVANLRHWPLGVLGLGTLANVVAIAANGGHMPASPEALSAAGMTEVLAHIAAHGEYANSSLLDEHTRLPFLTDIFAVPAGIPLSNVFSVGDVLIGLGALLLVAQAMAGGRLDRGDAKASPV